MAFVCGAICGARPLIFSLRRTTLVHAVQGAGCLVAVELEDEKWRRGNTTLVRRVAGEWEDEN